MTYASNSFSEDAAYVTIISSATGPVAKTFYLEDGEIKSLSKASIFEGTANTVLARTPEDLWCVIRDLGPNQALSLGRLIEPNIEVPLTTQAKIRSGAAARTQEYFKHSKGKGYLLLDVDTKDLPQELADKFCGRSILEVIFNLVPELEQSSRLVRASSSGGLVKPDGSERPATGYHVFILIKDQSQSKHLLNLIHDRLWEAGYGYYTTSCSGSLLERSLIDTTVHGPERLVFEAAPLVKSPLNRRKIPDEITKRSVLSGIKAPDFGKVKCLKNTARAAIKPYAVKKAKCYLDNQVEVIAAKTGVSKVAAKKIVRQRLQGCELSENDVLENSYGSSLKVSDFLDQANSSVGMPCPNEGRHYGTSTAYFYPADNHRPYPRILSFAHGRVTEFTFERFRHLSGLHKLKEGG